MHRNNIILFLIESENNKVNNKDTIIITPSNSKTSDNPISKLEPTINSEMVSRKTKTVIIIKTKDKESTKIDL